MARHLFGTDGIRGTPGVAPLDEATLIAIGEALGSHLRKKQPRPRILIGMDPRLSSPQLAQQIACGAAAAGAEIAFAGVISTPGVACLVRLKGFSAGVVISASHNPFTDNGVKLFSGSGTKFSDEVELELEREIVARRAATGAAPGSSPEVAPEVARKVAQRVALEADTSLDEQYLAWLRGFALPGAKLEGMKLVLDCANGAASALGPQLFRSLGAQVMAINAEPDGRNINVDCGSLYPESLRKQVVDSHAALGVAFDGDADRAIFSSGMGRIVDGDGVMLAAARHMKAAGTLKGDVVVGTTMSNLGLERVLASEGIRLVRAAVGDRYVLEEMLRLGANLGGEQSGHVIFLDDSVTGDGLLTALIIASLVSMKGPLEMLTSGLSVYPQKILNVRVKEKPPLEGLPGVAWALAEANRTLGNRGRIVLRYSGTESLARVMVEAEQQDDVERFTESIAAAIRAAIGAF
ncbi:MAG: phosphoglucosamine mutase [Acidipila sp.]|nr:phosphoglucosamine mutase [Acidipila sp.]